MSKAYNITLVFVADDDEEAEEIRADLIDYLLRYSVGHLAEVLPIRRES